MRRRLTLLVYVVSFGWGLGKAAATPSPGWIGTWWSDTRTTAVEAPPEPPKPVEVAWAKRRVGDVSVKGEVLAVAPFDYDGDGRDELVMLTQRELVILSGRDAKPVATLALTGTPAAVRSRFPVGMVDTTDAVIRFRTSDFAQGGVARQTETGFGAVGTFDGYPICGRSTVKDQSGKSDFQGEVPMSVPGAKDTGRFWSVRCSRGLVDRAGIALAVTGVVGTDSVLRMRCKKSGRACERNLVPRSLVGVGTAFDIVDVNRDGQPELVASGVGAPGGADEVQVFARDGTEFRRIVGQVFDAGVPALTAGDFDGDGAPEILVVERRMGAETATVWEMNR